jgi:hypothetical protein
MPLMKYFSFVGSALLLLLLGLNWFLAQAVSEPIGADIDRPVIRISSDEKLPDRVIIDASLPTIVPSPPTSQFAERLPEVEIAGPPEVHVADAKRSTRAANLITTDGALKTTNPTKSRLSNKSVTLRPAPLPNHHFSSSYPKQVVAPVTKMSLLDVIKDRFGRGFFKLN